MPHNYASLLSGLGRDTRQKEAMLTTPQMSNAISSPGDPIFFMRHAWLDRLWAQWQAQDPGARFKAMGGNNRANFTAGGAGGPPGGLDRGPPGDHGGPGAGVPPGGFARINMTRPADVP